MLYTVKYIAWNGQWCPIVLQSVNGPCPLLAIVNVLLLRGKLSLAPGTTTVTFEQLCAILKAHLEDKVQKACFSTAPGKKAPSEAEVANYLKNFEDTLKLLPKLEAGLDINCIFAGPSRFEYTSEIGMFDLFDIRLLHAWVYDPSDLKTAEALGNLSYNEVVTLVASAMSPIAKSSDTSQSQQSIPTLTTNGSTTQVPKDVAPSAPSMPGTEQKEEKSSSSVTTSTLSTESKEAKEVKESKASDTLTTLTLPETKADVPQIETASTSTTPRVETKHDQTPQANPSLVKQKSDQKRNIPIIKWFLEQNKGQMTVYGLTVMNQVIKDGELCVYFRNNHFAAVFKVNGRLYSLITDAGILAAAPYLAWHALNDVKGDDMFLDQYFRLPTQQSINDFYKLNPQAAQGVGQAPVQNKIEYPLQNANPLSNPNMRKLMMNTGPVPSIPVGSGPNVGYTGAPQMQQQYVQPQVQYAYPVQQTIPQNGYVQQYPQIQQQQQPQVVYPQPVMIQPQQQQVQYAQQQVVINPQQYQTSNNSGAPAKHTKAPSVSEPQYSPEFIQQQQAELAQIARMNQSKQGGHQGQGHNNNNNYNYNNNANHNRQQSVGAGAAYKPQSAGYGPQPARGGAGPLRAKPKQSEEGSGDVDCVIC